ncbi:GIY-YIG nuclease family protein [Streptomyces sp. NPDC058466]|uniref:GIY-YIG nuclease family protein n=1 Tax=Streptomyces sp. NPDC058466 TaxID=3346512 RepID=UPI003665B546
MPEARPTEVVYVLGTPDSHTVKIGRTVNIDKRFADIRTMSPVPLVILWTHPGNHELEAHLHRHFAEYRSHGEWFAFTEDPLPAIQSAVREEPWIAAGEERRRSREARRTAWRQRGAGLDPAFEDTLAEVRAIEDPVERFNVARDRRSAIAESDRSLRALLKNVVLGLRQHGLPWRQIGDRLGMSGARAEQIAKGRKPR